LDAYAGIVVLPLGRTSRHQPNWQAQRLLEVLDLADSWSWNLIIADLETRYDLA
jgi:hypothetical protein